MNSDFLFKEGMNFHHTVSVSQIQTFMSCPAKWDYSYIQRLAPRIERPYLTIGKLCHKGFEAAMLARWRGEDNCDSIYRAGLQAMDAMWEDHMATVPFLDEEIPEQEQIYTDAKSVYAQAIYEFDPVRYDVVTIDQGEEKIPALELHFWVPCEATDTIMHGYIDAILQDRETGHVWCTDYKFRKSFSDDSEERFNLQNSVYMRACKFLDIPVTGTMTWQHLNTPAADPAILKDGSISRARIKTTWEHYCGFCASVGADPAEYAEMEEKLADIEWYRSTLEYRNAETVDNIWRSIIVPATIRIGDAYNVYNPPYMYPWNCKMCQFTELCQAELRGYDVDYIKMKDFTIRSHR